MCTLSNRYRWNKEYSPDLATACVVVGGDFDIDDDEVDVA